MKKGKSIAMKFFRKIILNGTLGISVTVSLNSNCKAEGG